MVTRHARSEYWGAWRMTQPQRIFIVEDEILIAFEMTDILEDLGFEVVGPSVHVEEAEELARQEEIDGAFLDVNLGSGKDSEPVAEVLRERGVPFVFVTAYDDEQITFRTSDDRVLRKPVTGKLMLQTLNEVIGA